MQPKDLDPEEFALSLRRAVVLSRATMRALLDVHAGTLTPEDMVRQLARVAVSLGFASRAESREKERAQ